MKDGSMYGSQRTTIETLKTQKMLTAQNERTLKMRYFTLLAVQLPRSFLVALQVAQVEGKLITVSRRGNKASRERKSRMISRRRILAYQCPVLVPDT